MEPFVLDPVVGVSPSQTVVSNPVVATSTNGSTVVLVTCSLGASLVVNGILLSDKVAMVTTGKSIALLITAPTDYNKTYIENLYIDDQYDSFLVSTYIEGGIPVENPTEEGSTSLDKNRPPIMMRSDNHALEGFYDPDNTTSSSLVSGAVSPTSSVLVEADDGGYIDEIYNENNTVYRVEFIANNYYFITAHSLNLEGVANLDYSQLIVLRDGSVAVDSLGNFIEYTPTYDHSINQSKVLSVLVDRTGVDEILGHDTLTNQEVNIGGTDVDAIPVILDDVLYCKNSVIGLSSSEGSDINYDVVGIDPATQTPIDVDFTVTTNIKVDEFGDPAIDCTVVLQSMENDIIVYIDSVTSEEYVVNIDDNSEETKACDLQNLIYPECGTNTPICSFDIDTIQNETDSMTVQLAIDHLNSDYLPVLIPDFHNRVVYRYDSVFQRVIDTLYSHGKPYRAEYLPAHNNISYFIATGYFTGLDIFGPDLDTQNYKTIYNYDKTDSAILKCYVKFHTLDLLAGSFDLALDTSTNTIYCTGFSLGHVYKIQYDLTVDFIVNPQGSLLLLDTLQVTEDCLHSIVYIQSTNKLFATGFKAGKLYVIDCVSFTVENTITTKPFPSGIAYDSYNNIVWVSYTTTKELGMFDVNTQTLINTIDFSSYGDKVFPVDLMYDDTSKRINVADYYGHYFFSLDVTNILTELATTSQNLVTFNPHKVPVGFAREEQTQAFYMYSLYGDLYGELNLSLVFSPFDFIDQIDCDIDSYIESNLLNIIYAPNDSQVLLQPDLTTGFLVKNATVLVDRLTPIDSGDTLGLMVKTSDEYETTTITHVAINGYLLDFACTTVARSYIYDGLQFDPVYNAELTTEYTSNTETMQFSSDILVTEPNHEEKLTVTYHGGDSGEAILGELYVNDVLVSSNEVFIKHNDTIYIKITSSQSYTTDVYALVKIGSYKTPYLVQTKREVVGVCTEPTISFDDLYSIDLLTTVQSNVVNFTPTVDTTLYLNNRFRSSMYIDGVDQDIITLAANTSHTIQLELRTLPNNSLDHFLFLNIESDCDHNDLSKLWWKVRTIDDVEIDPIEFIDIYEADLPYVEYISNEVTISGIPVGVVLNIYLDRGILIINDVEVNTEYLQGESTLVGTVQLGDRIKIKMLTFFPMLTKTAHTVTVGDYTPVSGTWNVTTRMLDPYITDPRKTTPNDNTPSIQRVDKPFIPVLSSIALNAAYSPYYNSTISKINVSELSLDSPTLLNIKQVSIEYSVGVNNLTYSTHIAEYAKQAIPAFYTTLYKIPLDNTASYTQSVTMRVDFAVENGVYVQNVTQYTDSAVTDGIYVQGITQYTDLAVTNAVYMQNVILHTDLAVTDGVYVQNVTQYTDLAITGAVYVQSRTQYADIAVTNGLYAKNITQYTDSAVIVAVYMQNNTQYVDSAISGSVYVKNITEYAVYSEKKAEYLKAYTMYLCELPNIAVDSKATTTRLTVNSKNTPVYFFGLGHSIELENITHPVYYANVLYTVSYNSDPIFREAITRLSDRVDSTKYARTETIKNVYYDVIASFTPSDPNKTAKDQYKGLSSLSEVINLVDAVSQVVPSQIQQRLSQAIDELLPIVTYALQVSPNISNMVQREEVLERVVDMFAMIACQSLVASMQYPALYRTHQDNLSAQIPGNERLEVFHLTDNLLIHYLNKFHLTEQLPGVKRVYEFKSDSIPAAPNTTDSLYVTKPATISKMETYELITTDTMLMSYLNDIKTTPQFTMIKSTEPKLFESPEPLKIVQWHLPDFWQALLDRSQWFKYTEQPVPARMTYYKPIDYWNPKYFNHFWLVDIFPPELMQTYKLWAVAQALPEVITTYSFAYVERMGAIFQRSIHTVKLISPVASRSIHVTMILDSLATTTDSIHLSNIITPVYINNDIKYFKILASKRKPNVVRVQTMFPDFKLIKDRPSVHVTEYDCEEARYFTTAQAAINDGIAYGHDESILFATKLGEDCYVWGTLPDPSTACPEEDKLRGYVQGG